MVFLNILKVAEEAGRNFRAGASVSTRGDSRFVGTARAGVTELSSVGEDFTPISNGLRDGDAVFSKNSARLGLNTDSVKTESDCTPQIAGTSAKVTEGWGEMDPGANRCSSGGSFSTITSVMPSMRESWSSVGLLSVTAPLWGLVKTATEVGRAACFVTLAKYQHCPQKFDTSRLLTYLDFSDKYLERLGNNPSKRYLAELSAISPRNATI